MRIYHAQQAYHAEHKSWAKSLKELNLGAQEVEGLVLSVTEKGFQATINRGARGDQPKRVLSVREDSRLTEN